MNTPQKPMTQAEFINSFPAKDLVINTGGNITFSPSTPEGAKLMLDMIKKTANNSLGGFDTSKLRSVNTSDVTVLP